MNRLKVVLAETKRTNRWLAEQLGKDQATVSKWCTNISQPSLETLFQIAEVLGVKVQDLISKNIPKNHEVYSHFWYTARCCKNRYEVPFRMWAENYGKFTSLILRLL